MIDDGKKTALDENAAIYQKRTKKTEKEKWSEMDSAQRKQYFVDYYLFKTVAGILAIGIAIFLIWHFLGPKEEAVLYVAVVDESLDVERLEDMEQDLNELLGADGKRKQVIIDDSFYTKKDALTRMEVYLHSHQIDVVIADRDTYEEYAGYGFFQNMESVLGEGKDPYQDLYMMAAGYKDTDEISFEDEETGRGQEEPYGIDISKSDRFSEMTSYMEQPVFAIAEGAANPESAIRFLEYLMQKGE